MICRTLIPLLIGLVVLCPQTVQCQGNSSSKSGQAAKADTLRLNFADPGRIRVEKDIAYSIVIANILPKYRAAYCITQTRSKLEELPPVLPSGTPQSSIVPSPCRSAEKAADSTLAALTREADVHATVLGLLEDHAECSTLRDYVKTKIALPLENPVTLGEDEELRILVERRGAKAEFTLSTGGRGQWLVHYGFTFLPSRDETYFSKANADTAAGGYVLTKERDPADFDLDIAPSILVSWFPSSSRNRTLSPGIAAGMGYSVDNPQLFLGGALTYNANVMLTAGAVIHKQQRLKGKYSASQVVLEDLDEDSLHDSTFRPSWYAGLAFRLGENPFKSGADSGASAKDGKAEATESEPADSAALVEKLQAMIKTQNPAPADELNPLFSDNKGKVCPDDGDNWVAVDGKKATFRVRAAPTLLPNKEGELAGVLKKALLKAVEADKLPIEEVQVEVAAARCGS